MSIKDMLPTRDEEELIRGRAPIKVCDETRKHMQERKLSWTDVLTISLKLFNDEMRKLKTGKFSA